MNGFFFNEYPYTDCHELNLSWVIKKIIELNETVKNFVNLETIKYADPIQWNIASQYEKNTVVVDPQTGTAYISVAPVPSGVAISNTDYWTPIFDLDIATANNNITLRDDGNNVLSTFTSDEGDWLLWNGTLYKVTQAIGLSQAYVPGYNIDRYTVELFIHDYVTALTDVIGDLDDLNTTDKSSIVNALNEVIATIGDLGDLNTTDKTNIVNAINEVLAELGNLALITVDTVTDLIAYNASVGDVIEVLGYTTKGDNGSARYIIQSTSEVGAVALTNGLYGRIINDTLRPEMFGCVCDGVTDDYTNFNTCITYAVGHKLPIYLYGIIAIDGTITLRNWLTIIGAIDGVTIKQLGAHDLFYANNSDNLYFVTLKHLILRGESTKTYNGISLNDTDGGGAHVGADTCNFDDLEITSFNIGIRLTGMWLVVRVQNIVAHHCHIGVYWGAVDGCLENFLIYGCDSTNYGALHIIGSINRFVNGKVYLNYGTGTTGGVYVDGHQNSFVGLDVQDNATSGVFVNGTSNVFSGLIGSHNNPTQVANSYMVDLGNQAQYNVISGSSRNPNSTDPEAHHYAVYIRGNYNDVVLTSMNPKAGNYRGSAGTNYVRINGSVVS